MAFLHQELRKTISGKQAYVSNCSFLEFVNDSLRDIRILNSDSLPFYKNEDEEQTIKELLKMR